jgi:hypothetical protein
MKDYLKEKINKLETNSNNIDTRDLGVQMNLRRVSNVEVT